MANNEHRTIMMAIERVRMSDTTLRPLGATEHVYEETDLVCLELRVSGNVMEQQAIISRDPDSCSEGYVDVGIVSAVSATGTDWLDCLTDDEIRWAEDSLVLGY